MPAIRINADSLKQFRTTSAGVGVSFNQKSIASVSKAAFHVLSSGPSSFSCQVAVHVNSPLSPIAYFVTSQRKSSKLFHLCTATGLKVRVNILHPSKLLSKSKTIITCSHKLEAQQHCSRHLMHSNVSQEHASGCRQSNASLGASSSLLEQGHSQAFEAISISSVQALFTRCSSNPRSHAVAETE